MAPTNNEIIWNAIHIIMYFGDLVFAVSGALAAGQRRMDIIGYLLIGVITGLGGGTLRDVLLDRPVWWTSDTTELILCTGAAFCTFFAVPDSLMRHKLTIWSDALGLSAFAVVGSSIAMNAGVPWEVAVFMGVLTATGGGVIRDVLTDTKPIIVGGQLYAIAALAGSLANVVLASNGVPPTLAAVIGFLSTLTLRGAAIIFDIRLGPPDEMLWVRGKQRLRKTSSGK
jgi:uncharacterized membrane protein YeiH